MLPYKCCFITLLIGLFLFAGCRQENREAVSPTSVVETPVVEEATTVPEPSAISEETQPETAVLSAETGLLISELLLGVPGSNQEEFIELYNADSGPVDLQGYSLWYRLRDDQEEQQLIAWEDATLIPGHGHYLLVKEGQDFGLIPDATFAVSLYEGTGGLRLLDAEKTAVDQVGWGDEAPGDYVAGTAIEVDITGGSLERLPGGEAGNNVNSADNAADFILTDLPNPQNSGSQPTPLSANYLSMTLTAPEVVEPGSPFEYLITVTNESDNQANNATVSIPLPDYFELNDLPPTAVFQNDNLTLQLGDLAPGDSVETAVSLTSPFTYIDTLVSGHSVTADGFARTFGPLQFVAMAGGSIPISTARELVGNLVTVEGVATMYTGGFFAGSTGTKFYMEDENGGIQVYIPGGQDVVDVAIGDEVRVTGEIELYRDSLELIPVNIPDDVEILNAGAAEPEPALISVNDNETNDAVLGRLNAIEGTATRIEEFTYSYEVDLTDDEGNATLIYIEKDAGLTAEPMDVGKKYRIIGISEFYDTFRQLKPRLQEDIEEIFPPVVMVEQSAANNVQPGEILTYTVLVRNFTPDVIHDVVVTTQAPGGADNALQVQPDENGISAYGDVIWTLDEIAAEGGEAELHYYFTVPENAPSPLQTAPVEVIWAEASAPLVSDAYLTFIGSGVPIWAIQGPDFTSPYVRSTVTTEGVVTAVFSELGGFWLQEIETDDDPATSAGIFVLADPIPDGLVVGDLIQISGRVREVSGQTLIQPPEPVTIVTISTDNPLPEPAPYDPPADPEEAAAYNEALEGMLVALDGPAVAVAPTTQYGEYVMVDQDWGVDSVTRLEDVGYLIMVDDGSSVAHEDASTLPYVVARGDVVDGLVGPLAYTFENYKIEPVELPQIVEQERPLPTLPEAAPDEITIATFNVENFFDNKEPHPSDPPKPNKAAYTNKLNKVAEAILTMGAPTIIGLQEVENIGVLEDLVVLDQLVDYQYQPYLVDGTDPRGIDVAYLVRGDLVEVKGVAAYPAPEGLTSRPPLVLTATVNLETSPETLYVINNHFTSLSAGEEATEPRRTAQAAWNVTLIEQILANDPEAQIVVLGDLNSFYRTLPIDTLQNAGLAHAFDIFSEDEALPYTYIFQGKTQSLDHILVTQNLFARLGSVDALHIDADYPLSLPDDDSPRRVSDHDPLVVRLTFSH